MPELKFILPHWLYWGGLVVFPLVAYLIYHKANKRDKETPQLSLPLAYFLLITGGFLGIHRLYVKSKWVIAYIVLFVTILFVNVQVRDVRNELSGANNQLSLAEFKIERAEKAVAKGRRNAQAKLDNARQSLIEAQQAKASATEQTERWDNISKSLAASIVLLLIVDIFLLPGLVRKKESQEQSLLPDVFHCPVVEKEHDDTMEPFLFNRFISKLNGIVGEWVAYWSVLAVFVYYYEVIARYVFNSPTNWAHESMFLMFGMQYLLAGGFVLREGAHVRVDVIYMHLSKRAKAIVDIFTSIFFLIFMATLIVTGWTFFMDSYEVSEVSFTEWAIQYWPIKFALPLGGVLLLLQGISLLVKDIAVLINPAIAELDTEVRPEG
ncbi:MAG: TRAP transporter small permease subunit [Gammaproteobacteria bacterium]|nr:MAG: TRAP transporter small permease subunit [Gammaproteobacteria bacterium]